MSDNNKSEKSSRSLARTWPYPRLLHYEPKLREVAAAWFEKKKFPVDQKYKFILDKWENWDRNIILEEVASYVKRVKEKRDAAGKGFALHKYIHHGLSSQAMLFNLVGPLIVTRDYAPLRNAIENAELVWPDNVTDVQFEYEDRRVLNEDSGQPTSIDLVIGDPSKPALFVESKFVEKEFGGCSVFTAGDCDGRNPAKEKELCYLHHIGRKYWDLLEKHGFLYGPVGEERQCFLMAHYQYFREVLFALEKQGTFVLLCDERSPTFFCKGEPGERGLLPLLLDFTPPHLRCKVGMITIQSLVDEIEASCNHDWIGEFKEKYGLITT